MKEGKSVWQKLKEVRQERSDQERILKRVKKRRKMSREGCKYTKKTM